MTLYRNMGFPIIRTADGALGGDEACCCSDCPPNCCDRTPNAISTNWSEASAYVLQYGLGFVGIPFRYYGYSLDYSDLRPLNFVRALSLSHDTIDGCPACFVDGHGADTLVGAISSRATVYESLDGTLIESPYALPPATPFPELGTAEDSWDVYFSWKSDNGTRESKWRLKFVKTGDNGAVESVQFPGLFAYAPFSRSAIRDYWLAGYHRFAQVPVGTVRYSDHSLLHIGRPYQLDFCVNSEQGVTLGLGVPGFTATGTSRWL